jgi:hypothetical protein
MFTDIFLVGGGIIATSAARATIPTTNITTILIGSSMALSSSNSFSIFGKKSPDANKRTLNINLLFCS